MSLLIVDDEGNLRRMLRALLEPEGYEVHEAGSVPDALRWLARETPELVLLDLVLPGPSGLDLLPALLERHPGTPVIMMSGEASLADAMEATRRGAFHFLEKPLRPESVLATLRTAREVARARDLRRALEAELGPGHRLIGRSAPMEEVRRQIRKIAPTEARVLITGESGTGKELAAAAIHALSARNQAPFVRVNSAAIPKDLVESEMFGHERGAFTGALERRRGRFELADGGTLFLDEIGELEAGAQAKLLRVLESGQIQRVGSSSTLTVNVRLLSATHRNLSDDVTRGRFREDLLYRLDVIPLRMPAVRERPEDIPDLVAHATERLRGAHSGAGPEWSTEAMERLMAYRWPGNVRELMNFVERVSILHPNGPVDGAFVDGLLHPGKRLALAQTPGSPALPSGVPSTGPLRTRLEAFERAVIEEALAEAKGNMAAAARLLETDRANLYRRMRRLEIPIQDDAQGSGDRSLLPRP
jgi:two-component system, NtrC family, nitrogen regulation response regulator NtrX